MPGSTEHSTTLALTLTGASVTFSASSIYGAIHLLEYAATRLLSEWLLPGLLPLCLRLLTPFLTSMVFETLSSSLGCLPLNSQYFSTAVGLNALPNSFTVCHHSVHFYMPFQKQLFTSSLLRIRTTSIAFVENQLSQSLISLSPLPTSPPNSLQRLPVQSSMLCY